MEMQRIAKRLQYRSFPMNIAKFLRTAFFTERLWWLLFVDQKNEENDMLNLKSSNPEVKLFWIFTKKHPLCAVLEHFVLSEGAI